MRSRLARGNLIVRSVISETGSLAALHKCNHFACGLIPELPTLSIPIYIGVDGRQNFRSILPHNSSQFVSSHFFPRTWRISETIDTRRAYVISRNVRCLLSRRVALSRRSQVVLFKIFSKSDFIFTLSFCFLHFRAISERYSCKLLCPPSLLLREIVHS